MDYAEMFQNTKQKLMSIGANIHKEETELVLTKEELPYFKDGDKIKGDLFEFYNSLNGLEFDWSLNTADYLLTGFINIHSFEEMIENKTENKLWVDWYEKDDIKEIKKHYIFETIVGTDYYITIKFDADNNYKLYYVPEGSVNHGGSKNLSEIPLKIDQYFKVINSYFGIHMIRHHLHEEKFYTHPFDVLPELKLLENFFPDFKPPQINFD